MVEIFADRMEITNPGAPLIQTNRFLDNPPRSRNESLASLMRMLNICEERGSGVDKVVAETELYQLPAPKFEAVEDFTRVTLYAHKAFGDMDREDRIRACYLHTCLRFVTNSSMSNSSLRERFGIPEYNASIVSRIIQQTTDEGLIRPYDPQQARRTARYVPFWA